jgi:hypothetical protein
MLFVLGFVGLLFPGWVAYVVIAGLAKCTKDQDMFKFLVQFAECHVFPFGSHYR